MKRKIAIISLGCPKNLVDSEIMAGLLKGQGFELVDDKLEAEVIIINTCGFIESAREESIAVISEVIKLKKKMAKYVIAAGCMAERYKGELISQIPEIDVVLGTANYAKIADIVQKLDLLNSKKDQVLCGNIDEYKYVNNIREISTGSYAYIKIAEGCNNKCSYCVIPRLRGKYISRPVEEIIDEAQALACKGIKELIIIAQDTTKYGIDIYGEKKLAKLLNDLGKIDGIKWLRVLYCYPEDIDTELIEEIANNKKVCKYLDIPIQHASDKILSRMKRQGDNKSLVSVIRALRERVDGIVIRTSMMVGFPGETKEDFEELYDFVKQTRFERLGAFVYSREENTLAGKMRYQVGDRVKEKRYRVLMELQNRISSEINQKREGNIYETLVEGIADDGIFYFGRTYGEAPEIDGKIYFTSSYPLEIGQFVKVRILEWHAYDLIGAVDNESS